MQSNIWPKYFEVVPFQEFKPQDLGTVWVLTTASTMTPLTTPTHVGGIQGCCWLGAKPHTGAATAKQCCSPAMTNRVWHISGHGAGDKKAMHFTPSMDGDIPHNIGLDGDIPHKALLCMSFLLYS